MADENLTRNLLSDAAERGISYRENIADRAVEPSAEAVAGAGKFMEPMPEKGMDDRQVLEMLDTHKTPNGYSDNSVPDNWPAHCSSQIPA